MFIEYPNGGMTELASRNIDFLEDQFPEIGEVKNDLELHSYNMNYKKNLSEGGNVSLSVTQE